MSEATDTLIGIVHALDNASTIEVMDFNFLFLAALALKHELGSSWLVGTKLHALIYIAIGMTGDGDRLLPVLHTWVNTWDGDRSTEHGTIHDATDGSIRTLPHLVQMIFVHALCIRCDGGTFHSHTIFLGCLGRVDGHLVVGLVTIRQA